MPESNQPILPETPALPGLSFRYVASFEDYVGMAEVHAGSYHHDQIDPHSSRESIPDEAQLRRMFPEETVLGNPDLLLVTMNDEQVIGYNHVKWRWT